MLDEFGNEIELTDSRLDSTMKRVAKVLHLNNGSYLLCPLNSLFLIKSFPVSTDRNQWTAIIVLSVFLVIIILLFIIL